MPHEYPGETPRSSSLQGIRFTATVSACGKWNARYIKTEDSVEWLGVSPIRETRDSGRALPLIAKPVCMADAGNQAHEVFGYRL